MKIEALADGVTTYNAINTVIYPDRVEFSYKPKRKSIYTNRVVPLSNILAIKGMPKYGGKKSNKSGEAQICVIEKDLMWLDAEGEFTVNDKYNVVSVEDENGVSLVGPIGNGIKIWEIDESTRKPRKTASKKDKDKKDKKKKKK